MKINKQQRTLQFNLVSEMNVVDRTQEHTESHLNDSKSHRHFHLEGVEEDELVVRVIPRRIDTPRIGRSPLFPLDGPISGFVEDPFRFECTDRDGGT